MLSKNKQEQDGPALGGDVITDAAPSQDPQSGEVVVTLKMNSSGARKWWRD